MASTPPMTADDARTFQGFSAGNAAHVLAALEQRGCSCQPYQDVFTFNRWRAQGRTVRRGEHGIKLPVIVSGQKVDDQTGETETFRMRRTSAVFCRCQTDALMHRAYGIAQPSEVIVEVTDPRLAAIGIAPDGSAS